MARLEHPRKSDASMGAPETFTEPHSHFVCYSIAWHLSLEVFLFTAWTPAFMIRCIRPRTE